MLKRVGHIKVYLYFFSMILCFIFISFDAISKNNENMPNDNTLEATSNTYSLTDKKEKLNGTVLVSVILVQLNQVGDSLLFLKEEFQNNDSSKTSYNSNSNDLNSKKKEIKNKSNKAKPVVTNDKKELDSFDKMWQDIIGVAWFGGYAESPKQSTDQQVRRTDQKNDNRIK